MINPPGINGVAKDWTIPETELVKLPGWRLPKDEDLKDAKQLLAQAGYPNGGPSFSISFDQSVDFTKAEKSLPGFKPQWTLRAGIEELYTAYRDHGMSKDEFLGPRYYRLKVIRGRIERGELDTQLRWKA